jgi:sensor histidine kinase YesM
VEIRGILRGNVYELYIRDNGPGFRAETLEALEEQMREIQRTGTLPSLKISGMGILHVYIRFRLLYDDFIFRLENNPEGGACVTIGAGTDEQSV